MKTSGPNFKLLQARLLFAAALCVGLACSLTAATFTDANWTTVGAGVDNSVRALASSGSSLYAGGYFTTAGGSAASHIAKWNGSSWSALGSGVGDAIYGPAAVFTLAASGSDLYVGGNFTTAGGSAGYYIAKWDGNSWTTLGAGLEGVVWALVESGSDLYVGGAFARATNSGGATIEAHCIARWNGSSWSPLDSGMGGGAEPGPFVLALARSGSDLYAGGAFTTAGGSLVNYVAKWNGTNWSALGSGMDNSVYALVMSGADLYAAGSFTTAGGSSANHIAKWNGTNWSAVGSGMDGDYVYALAASGSNLYAAGYFTHAAGISANNIARWDGTNWTALGSGTGGGAPHVFALAASASDLYAGGLFTTAGGKPASYIARAYLLPLPTLSISPSGKTNVALSWPSANSAFSFEQAATLAAPVNWVSNTAAIADDGTNQSVTLPAANGMQFFRLRRP